MYRIAIVDDSEINLTLLSTLVKKLDSCEPHLFSDATKGLDWCVNETPDLVIVDYMMPGVNGLQFISRLRAVPGREDVPILMITANDDKDVRYEALAKRARRTSSPSRSIALSSRHACAIC